MTEFQGGCLCGAVRYRVEGSLRDIHACHCSQCRRVTGHYGAFSACKTEELVFESNDGLASAGIDWWDAFFGNLQGMMGTTSLLAIGLGGAMLIVTRIASWRLILGQLLGLMLVVILFNLFGSEQGITTLPWHWHVVLGSFAFGAVFLATDPASSASTNAGRWVQGLMVGALVVMMRVANPAHPDGVILAVLMGSILAPLIDHVVIWFNVKQRARRYG